MSEEILKVTVDKFTFLAPKGLFYSDAGVWIKLEGNRARLGLSDFAQQQNGDVAFANIKPVGTALESGDEFAEIETVKVDSTIPSPLKGTIVESNASLAKAAELINLDPYGQGWLAVVELADWDNDRAHLLEADAYLDLVKDQAEAEMRK